MSSTLDLLPTSPTRDKVVSAADAVRLVRDGDTIAIEAFGGIGFPESLTLALEDRFLATGSPRDLGLVFTTAPGDRAGRGIDRICHEGMISRVVGGHFGMSGAMQRFAMEGKVEAHNLPQGVVAQLFRDTAAGKPGLISPVGIGTFVDPRFGGGKVNDRTTRDLVEVMTIDGREYLFYKAFQLDVALLRGTTADPEGNITMEREALTLEALSIATAVHNQGGLVIVQVERLADSGSLHPREVKIPGVLVDCVVVAEPEQHWQTFGTPYSAAHSGEIRRVPLSAVAPMAMSPRKVIARRAAMELRPNSVVNLGIGMPEGVAAVAKEELIFDFLTLTAEPGVIGGLPAGGLDFGAAVNAQAIIDQPYQFDFYDGGGLDAAFLGMAEADRHGNVNVSRFGPKLAGSGGFINISQNAKRVFYLGTFLAPCDTSVAAGRLMAGNEPGVSKFVAEVEQRTFSGPRASELKQPVLYITDRCVFELSDNGLALVEIAPGLDLERDVLAFMSFEPIIVGTPRLMDARLFAPEPMGLKDDLLRVPLDARFSYDEERNVFFLNFEGLALRSPEEVDIVRSEVSRRLEAIGHKVHLVANYDNFALPNELHDQYTASVRDFTGKYYLSTSRYTTSSFMRLKLNEQLASRGVAPHVYESRAEALQRLE